MKLYEFGKENKTTIMCLKRAFPELDIHPFANMGHGENMRHPELVARDLKAFMMKNGII